MLPVRVKVLSSSSCSLSQASSLLQRFLSGDACSDPLARDYVANVAQALQDSISRTAEESATSASAHASFERQKWQAGKHGNGELSAISAVDYGTAAGSAIQEAENAHKRHKKKRRHSALENGTDNVVEFMQEADDSAIVHHEKKRRKKEKADLETEHLATEKATPDDEKSRKKQKHDWMIEPSGTDNVTPEDQKRRKYDRVLEPFGIDNVIPDDQKGRKKHKRDREGEHTAIENVTPDKERPHEKKKRKDRQEVENVSIEPASPALKDQKSHEKSKRKKEHQSKEVSNIKTLHVPEFANPPTESLVKKKRHAGNLEAKRITESGDPAPPMSPTVNEKEGSSKKEERKNRYVGHSR
ncbi:hypothetical protein L7F22_056784 [Adiantum nelumboides]|nr:hypothetical protein [Adiantum nelumboides]